MNFEDARQSVLCVSNDGRSQTFVEAVSLASRKKLRFGYAPRPQRTHASAPPGLTRPWGRRAPASA